MIRTALVLLLAAQMSAVGASFQAKGTLSFVVTDPETHVQTTRDAPFEVERLDPFWTISITGPAGQGSTSFQSFGDSNETIRITRSRGNGAEDTTIVTVDPVPMPIPGGDDAFVIWLTLLSDSYFTKHTTLSFAPFYLSCRITSRTSASPSR